MLASLLLNLPVPTGPTGPTVPSGGPSSGVRRLQHHTEYQENERIDVDRPRVYRRQTPWVGSLPVFHEPPKVGEKPAAPPDIEAAAESRASIEATKTILEERTDWLREEDEIMEILIALGVI